MVTEEAIKESVSDLEAWIGRKMDTRFMEKWLDTCQEFEYGPFVKAMDSFKGEDYFPNLRDLTTAYKRESRIVSQEVEQKSCDWCDEGILIYFLEKGGREYEYEGKCGNCHPAGKRFENLLLIYPSKPSVKLHSMHYQKKEFCDDARANNRNPYAPVFQAVSNPYAGERDDAKERARYASIKREEQREEEIPF